MQGTDDQKEYLQSVRRKIDKVVTSGGTTIERIPEMLMGELKGRIDSQLIESLQVDRRVQKRRYGTKEAAELAGISHTLLYAAEEDGRLPKPDYRTDTDRKVRAGYTVNQINHIRRVFGTAPKKPEGASPAVVGMLNLKGGSYKTTSCHLFSQYLAIRGYKVLLIDTDPQGSLSFYFGKQPDVNIFYENTIGPFMLEDDAALVEAGHSEGSSSSLHYAVQNTYWDNIDIIPACLQNLQIDLLMSQMVGGASISMYDRIMKLRHGVLEVGQDYDFIVIDGTPSLNISTLNVICACDMCFVPTPAAMLDYASTLQFANLISETIASFEEEGIFPNIPDVRYFITKYSGSSYAIFMSQFIRKVFTVERGDVLSSEAHHSDEIGKSTTKIESIYEVNPSSADNRKRLKQTKEMFDALFGEMHDAVWETCYESYEKLSPGFDEKLMREGA